MTDELDPPKRLDAGDVVRTSARVLGSSLPALFAGALVANLPTIFAEVAISRWRADRLLAVLAAESDPYFGYVDEDELLRISTLALAGSVLARAFGVVLTQALVLYPVVERLAGRSAGVGAALGKGLMRVPSAFVALVLVSCTMLFTASCFVVPAFVFAVLFSLAVPAAILEDRGSFSAVGRSVSLTKDNWGVIAALAGVALVVFGGVGVGLGLAIDGAAWIVLDAEDVTGAPAFSYHVLHGLVIVIEAMLIAVVAAVTYARLREDDGIDAESLAEVFA